MASTPPVREDPSRSRRRRRRPHHPAAAPSNPNPNPNSNSTSTTPTRPHRRPPGPFSSSAQTHSRRRADPAASDGPKPKAPANPASAPAPASSSAPSHSAEALRQQSLEKQHEARLVAERARHAAALHARRLDERRRNLPYLPVRPSDESPTARPTDAELRQYDSSLKKCTGFLRKIRFSGVTDDSVHSLCTEADSLNLSRYISEVVSAMSESKLRSADIEHFVTLSGHLHRRYDDFVTHLSAALVALVLPSPPTPARELSVRKAAMRALFELYVLAMLPDVNVLTFLLRQLMRPHRDARDDQLNNLAIVATFVKASSGILIPKIPNSDQPSPQSSASPSPFSEQPSPTLEEQVASQAVKQSISLALQAYIDGDVNRLVKDAVEDFRLAGEAVTRSKQVRDSPDDATAAAFDAAKQFCDRAVTNANVLSDALGRSQFSIPSNIVRSGAAGDGAGAGADAGQVFVSNPFNYISKNRHTSGEMDIVQNADHPFESDEQRMFYTELIAVEAPPTKKGQNGEKHGASGDNGDKKSDGGSSTTSEKSNSQRGGDGKKKGNEKPHSLERLLNKLPSVETKDAADHFVQQFVVSREGSRNGTKRLARALSTVSPQKLNVLPAYSRIAACLQPLFGDIPTAVASFIEEEFRVLVGKADVDEKSLAVCVKCAQYIGEYVKFNLISISSMFDLLSLCMKDLSAHRVDAACNVLESCGRYVFRTSTSHMRMNNILDTLWRVKSVKNLEAKHNTLIENAFYAVKLSPGSKAQKIKVRPPLHEYVRHLIYYNLGASNVIWTRNQLLKLPWDEEIEFYVIKKFVKISRARYSTIPHVASLIFALQKHKPAVVVSIVDALLECIRSGMEKNDGRESQRRLAEIVLIGEMHNCGVVDEKLVYSILYLIITLGHDSSELLGQVQRRTSSLYADFEGDSSFSQHSRRGNGSFGGAPDPPGDFFRIRLACVLVEVCGKTLVESNRRKLEVYWVFLERYLFCKTYQSNLQDRVPLHIGHIMDDVLEGVVSNQKRNGKEGRTSGGGGHGHGYNGGRGASTGNWASSAKSFKRSKTLDEALKAVDELERCGSDVALISVPERQVVSPTSDRTGGDGSKPNDILATKGRGTGTADSASTSETSKAETTRDHQSRLSEDEGDESTSEGVVSEDEDGTVLDDGDDELSGDDLVSDTSMDEYDDDDEDEDDDEDDDGHDDDEDDEDEVLLDLEAHRPKTEEESAFAKELEAFTAEAVQDARSSTTRGTTRLDRMAIPMSLMTRRMEEDRATAAAQAMNALELSESSSDDTRSNIRQGKKAMEFKVLFRKGGKSHLHVQNLKVPASSSLAVAAKESESADARRHEETKQLVLKSSIVQNEDTYDFEDEVPLQVEQNARAKEESIRQQRSADEQELLSTLYRSRPRR